MISLEKLKIDNEIKIMFENTLSNFISDIGEMIKNYLTGFIRGISKLPNFLVYAVITILSTYFISSDKFYILDRMEYHFPKKWIGNVREKVRKIKNSLGAYLKAEVIMIGVTFMIVLIGLYIFSFAGLNIEYPFLMAIITGFVDALPILGSGTVLIPWSIISLINSDVSLGCALLGLYIFIVVSKQFIEPKVVSNKIGIHPIFTLIAMYTGFKFLGLIGLLAGPIILIILKNIFSNSIDKGITNAVVDKF